MKEQEIHIDYKARYCTLGDFNEATRKIWFVLHGYGQLARFFIRKFKTLSDEGVYVIAPEGLSKFYLEDVTTRAQSGNSRVGAAWMTSENRLADIENYIHYLNTVYEKEVPDSFDGEITFLGFSQGTATATRWAIDGNKKFHRLVLWSGLLPPDLDFVKANEILHDKIFVEVLGKADPYITSERMKEMTELNALLNIKPVLIDFNGGHDIDEDVLKGLIL